MKSMRHNLGAKGRFCTIRRIIKSVVKGFATGAGFAGVINTVAPGAIPTFCGYLVGKGFGNILVKRGLITLGVFSRPSVNGVAVLILVGAIFGVLYGVTTLILECARGISRCKRRHTRHNPRHF